MKKQFIAGLAAIAAASMLCGFDSAETLDSLSEKMADAGSSVESMAMATDFSLDAALKISDGSTDVNTAITASGPLEVKATTDPAACSTTGSIEFSAISSGQTIQFESYTVTDEDGAIKTYIKNPEDGTWTVQTADGLDIGKLLTSVSSASAGFSQLEDWGVTCELAPEAADADGTECYLVSAVIDASSLDTLIQKASEMSGTDLEASSGLSQVLPLLDGLSLKLEYYVDAATYLPVKLHIDMNDSDLTGINQLISTFMGGMGDEENPSSAELVLNDLSIDAALSYNDVAEITVPEEALSAEAPEAAAEEAPATEAAAE